MVHPIRTNLGKIMQVVQTIISLTLALCLLLYDIGTAVVAIDNALIKIDAKVIIFSESLKFKQEIGFFQTVYICNIICGISSQ